MAGLRIGAPILLRRVEEPRAAAAILRRMIPVENTASRYGLLAIVLHWAMALIILALVAMGLYMVRLPDVGFNKEKILLIIWHKEFGVLALMLFLLRFAWRFGGILPRLVEGFPEWQQVAARFVHLCFYALMFALPMSGWLMSSAAGIPVSFFGLFYLPDLIGYDDYRFQKLITIHHWLGYALIPFIFVHAGAALGHHFVYRDETLRRMLPS
jgi:cytochrome b561